MDQRKPRIVITGPMGSGKSTLAAALCERLGLTFLREDMTKIVSFVDPIHALRQRFPPASPRELNAANNAWMKAHIDWVLVRKHQYAKADGFVADRWEADILSFWLVMFGQYYPDVQTRLILDHMKKTANTLDFVVRLPLAHFDYDEMNDDGLKRRAQLSIQLLYDSARDGLMSRCSNLRILDIPEGRTSVEERCDMIIERLAAQASPN